MSKSTLNNLTIIVNTSDNFEDCWAPFFKLFFKYWPNCEIPIILNTEKKQFIHNGNNILSSQVNLNFNRRLTWSECLIEVLKKVETPLILYMQEDYFIDNPVNVRLINDFVNLMTTDKTVKYIGLTNFGNLPPFIVYPNDLRLRKVSKSAKYRISTQAAIWSKETLMSYLRVNENGWMFEIFGTQRAKRKDDLFLTVNREMFVGYNQIISYQPTGIIKGKWLSTIPKFFETEEIKMDFSIRGFYKNPNTLIRKFETFNKLIKNPIILIKGMLGK